MQTVWLTLQIFIKVFQDCFNANHCFKILFYSLKECHMVAEQNQIYAKHHFNSPLSTGRTAVWVLNHICTLFCKYNSKTWQVFFTMHVHSDSSSGPKNIHIIINTQKSVQRLTTSKTKQYELKEEIVFTGKRGHNILLTVIQTAWYS